MVLTQSKKQIDEKHNILRSIVVGIVILSFPATTFPQKDLSTEPCEQEISVDVAEYGKLSQEIERILQLSDIKIQNQDWAEANILIKQGLDLLEYKYSTPSRHSHSNNEETLQVVLDDSEVYETLALIKEKEGDFESAIKIKRDLLKDRNEMLKEKIRVLRKY